MAGEMARRKPFRILLIPLLGFLTDTSGLPTVTGRAVERETQRGWETDSRTHTSGPLKVSEDNPRYFADRRGKAVYLTGSHHWANFQDVGYEGFRFDYTAYLDMLEQYGHSVIRLWVWEQAAWVPSTEDKVLINPLPYERTGPGEALDGQPKFDLTRWNQAYFARLRERVEEAGKRGLYVMVMLFQGASINSRGLPGNPWRGHPFSAENNINGVDGDVNKDGEGEEVHTLAVPAVTALQERYVRKVIDTVNEFDNVLYEIANESHGGSTHWQYHMTRFVQEYERIKRLHHPVVMSIQYPGGSNHALYESPADAISPTVDSWPDETIPPPADGRKVILIDTDHLWGVGGDPEWVWGSFFRGLNPLLMDPWVGYPWKTDASDDDVGYTRDPFWVQFRKTLGYARQLADHVDLANVEPRPELASSRHCLADPGVQYLVYVPAGGPVSVQLGQETGLFHIEWFNPATGRTRRGEPLSAGGRATFTPPFKGDAILYLYRSTSVTGER